MWEQGELFLPFGSSQGLGQSQGRNQSCRALNNCLIVLTIKNIIRGFEVNGVERARKRMSESLKEPHDEKWHCLPLKEQASLLARLFLGAVPQRLSKWQNPALV